MLRIPEASRTSMQSLKLHHSQVLAARGYGPQNLPQRPAHDVTDINLLRYLAQRRKRTSAAKVAGFREHLRQLEKRMASSGQLGPSNQKRIKYGRKEVSSGACVAARLQGVSLDGSHTSHTTGVNILFQESILFTQGGEGAGSLHKGKDYLIFLLTGTSDRWVFGFWGRKLSYPGKIFITLVKKVRKQI